MAQARKILQRLLRPPRWAMIARFSENAERFRRMMNAATGGCIYIFVILIAAGMLLRGRKTRKEGIAR